MGARGSSGSVYRLSAPGARARLYVFLLIGLAMAALGIVLSLPPIPQDPAYHHFADGRAWWGVPNFFNVISNGPFVVVGGLGLIFLWQAKPSGSARAFLTAGERWPYGVLFGGVVLVGLGSAYYHGAPGDARLVWDRLPMTIVFMAFLSATITERIRLKAGVRLLAPLVLAGLASVLYWHWTERGGAGDLRLYIFVQYFPMLAIPLIMWLFPPRYTGGAALLRAVGWYGAAKVCELLDAPIFARGGWVSGHTLKHLAAGMAVYAVLCMLKTRHPLESVATVQEPEQKYATS